MMIFHFSLFPTAINTIIIENVNRHKKKYFSVYIWVAKGIYKCQTFKKIELWKQ